MERELSIVYKKLQANEIICENLIRNLRFYISKKYPEYKSKKSAEVFADSINKIIDRNIHQFNNNIKEDLKKQLLLNSIRKNNFKITAADIFDNLITLPINLGDQTNQLKNWLEDVQEIEISSNELEEFLNEVQNIDTTYDINFETILDNIYEKRQHKIQADIEDNVQNNFEDNIQERIQENVNEKKSFNYVLCFKVLTAVCIVLTISIGILLAVVISNQYEMNNEGTYISAKNEQNNTSKGSDNIQIVINNGLENEFVYKDIDIVKLKQFLNKRHSMLVREPYISTIINTAKQYDVNPLLILAIAGQEQGFVPEDDKDALKIANNPFNLYGSWMNYNTDIKSACKIVARTIINLNKGKPEGYDTIKWINREYAEDKSWHNGVKAIFLELKDATNK